MVSEFAKYAEVTKVLDSSVKLIIPTVDEELPFFASAKDYFLSKGIRVMVGSENTIYHCRDKMEFHQWCNRHGFVTPRTWQLDGYLKPRFGKGSRGQTRVKHNYILQENCPFPEYSVDYFADFDCNIISIIPRLRLDIQDGESQKAVICMQKDIIDTCKRLGRELELVGHNVIQGYYTGETFILGEVNPRFGGGSHLTFGLFSSPKWLIDFMGNDNVSKRESDSLRGGIS